MRALGRVSDAVRDALLHARAALVVPSPYESLSIVLLEGGIAPCRRSSTARCKVLEGQVRRANGGLYYRSSAEFAEAVETLRALGAERARAGRQGLAYVEREYRWPTVMERVERLLDDALVGAPCRA